MDPGNKQYQLLVENLPEAYACLHVITGSEDKAEECVLVAANPAFEVTTGLKRHEIVGRQAADILPAPEQGKLDWVSIYLIADKTGEALRFKQYSKNIESWHLITAYSDRPGYLSVIFKDITPQQENKELHKSKNRFSSLVKSTRDGIVVEDEERNIILTNQAFCDLFDIPAPPEVLVGSSCKAAAEGVKHLLSDPDTFANRITEIIANRQPVTGEEIYFADGRVLERDYIPVFDEAQHFIGHMWHYRDITKSKETEKELRKKEEKYRQILSTIEEGYYEIDTTGKFSFFNSSFCRMLGYEKEELFNKNYKIIFSNPDEVFKTFKRVFKTGNAEKAVGWPVITKTGDELYVEASVSLRQDESGDITGFKGIVRDITERKRYEEKLEHMSFHDSLTGLYNRAFFVEEMNRLSNSREHPITVISADLDKLKLINDTMGHSKGDELLKACAEVLASSLRGSDILVRVGGDEFAVLLPQTDDKTGAEITRRIQANVDSYNRSNPDLPMSITSGLASASSNKIHLEETYKEANDLMLRNKLAHRTNTDQNLIELMIKALDEKDYLAYGHADRLSRWCVSMGEKLALSNNQLNTLKILARIHDLGKVAVPDKILFKKEALNNKEWENIRQHPEKGSNIAITSSEYSRLANLIHTHHERWDGSGYPSGLKGEEIPIEGRILAIADAFDVMTSNRPYREAFSKEEAIKELKACAGKEFDPELVQAFLKVIEDEQNDEGNQ